ncbi:hypothetical protein F5Y07DRAFT_393412 [Xylaria sp. FL0933]|nr:hypothetical protein F5Y07DRAFT_393412 [Xylaria sp. FL0933]
MPTPLDNAMKSKNAVLGINIYQIVMSRVLMELYFKAFSGLVTAAVVWSFWGGDIFPAQADPKGNPETWTREELRRWLAAFNRHEGAALGEG